MLLSRQMRGAGTLAALGCLSMVTLCPGTASAQKTTTLLEDDLPNNKRTKIDGAKDSLDSALDDALGGPTGFSTKSLEKIEDRLRAELKRDRPRAIPRLIVFLYPGKITADKLKTIPEVNVDIELVMDPCERAVCRDAVAKHIEMVGRAVGQTTIASNNSKVIFKSLTLETAVKMHDTEVQIYKVPLADCIVASQKSGGGAAWLASQDKAEQDYEPLVAKAILRHAQIRRVSLEGAPKVSRTAADVGIGLKMRGDRARVQSQIVDALAATAEGLRDNPKTPSTQQIDITIDTGGRDGTRRFRAPGNPVALYLDKKLDGGALWSSYVAEVKKQPGASTMSFDDGEASGKSPVGEPGEPDDNAVVALLSANFASIGGCAKAEAGKNAGFKGVTVVFKWLPSGKADNITTKEPALKNSALAKCLQGAISSLALPRFSGGARELEYPIRLK